MEISVIVPSYKPGEYLWECLDSLKQQTLNSAAFEVIIVLNGCCEPWKSQISDYIKANNLTNFRLLQTNEGGVSNARNIGIDNAKGEYITFIDDDDYVSHHYLEGLLDSADDKSVVLSDSCAFYDDETKQKIQDYHPHVVYQRYKNLSNCSLFLSRAIFNGPCMKLLSKSIIQDIRFDASLSVGEDSLFMFAISKNVSRIRFADDSAIYYRRYRKNSAITTTRPISFWIKNSFRIQCRFFRVWLQNPFRYNFPFFCTRLIAPLKGVYNRLKGKL